MIKKYVVSIYLPVFLIIFSVVSTIPVLSYLTFVVSGSELLSTFVISVFGLSYLLSSVPVGVIHEYVGREVPLIIFGIILMVSSTVLFFTYNPFYFILGRILVGFGETFVFVGYIAMIIGSSPNLGDAAPLLGQFFGFMGLALMVAPSFGSQFITLFDPSLLFYIYAIIQILCIVIILFSLRLGLMPKRIASVRQDSSFITYRKSLIYVGLSILMIIAVGFSDGSIQSRAVSWMYQINISPEYSGYLITIYYIAAISSQFTLPIIADKRGLRTGFYINLTIGVLCFILFVLSYSTGTIGPYSLFLLVLLIGVGVGLLLPFGTEATTRIFGSRYLLGSGVSNMLWALGYFTFPTFLSFIGFKYVLEILLIIVIQIFTFMIIIRYIDLFRSH
jgi:MFS family permease